MTMVWEKIVVTAREFVLDKNINDCREFNEPLFKTKLIEFDWEPRYSAACVTVEIVWKIALGRESTSEMRRLDRLFTPSPVATHTNFRGCRYFKTGNIPETGAIVVWKRGNSWQGHIGIVSGVSSDKNSFDVIEGKILTGSEGNFIQVSEAKDKMAGLPFRSDKLNLLGFIYPPNREIA